MANPATKSVARPTLAEALRNLADAVEDLNQEAQLSFTQSQLTSPAVVAPMKAAKAKKSKYTEVDSGTPQTERERRQKLILEEIEEAGGEVSRDEWLKITARFGYTSKRLGGFFGRSTNGVSAGMVLLSADRKSVQLTDYGRSRIQNIKS